MVSLTPYALYPLRNMPPVAIEWKARWVSDQNLDSGKEKNIFLCYESNHVSSVSSP
jgi:hypothetical protein